MAKKRRYTEDFYLETGLSKEDIIQKLSFYFTNIKVGDQVIELVRSPKVYHFLAVRGKAIIQLKSDEADSKTVMDGIVHPFVLFSRAGSLIFLILVAICSGVLLLFPFNGYILSGFIIEWLLATIFAPYLLFACTFIWMTLILFSSVININTFITLTAAWLLTFWIIHLSLSFNKRQLKKYFMRKIRNALR